jgi:phosphoenolpyruvate carboxykinase (GTP)
MGPINSPLSRCGVEITDSPYVVANMRLMTRMGSAALARIEREGTFVRGLHSVGELDPERRFIMHFPEDLEIQSYGSGYGGNALLGKKCHALRIASYQARTEGWLAEHMLIVGVENPQGEVTYVAAAFPSACGKTNMAMLIPPEEYNSNKTNPNAMAMLHDGVIFTNVGVTADNQPWWEGMAEGEPVLNWRGQPYSKDTGPAAQPNSRFTAPIEKCPSYSEMVEAPNGVPISAIVFGGRRERLVPLVAEAKSWEHGVLLGASMASETTAAAVGAVGAVRRDPMAMKPFCGYNFADYWKHWLDFGLNPENLPAVFHVNWFRKDEQGEFMWPGFCENMRVLEWIVARCKGEADAVETPIGLLPTAGAINTTGIDTSASTLSTLLEVDREAWSEEMAQIREYFESYGERLPERMLSELEKVSAALEA